MKLISCAHLPRACVQGRVLFQWLVLIYIDLLGVKTGEWLVTQLPRNNVTINQSDRWEYFSCKSFYTISSHRPLHQSLNYNWRVQITCVQLRLIGTGLCNYNGSWGRPCVTVFSLFRCQLRAPWKWNSFSRGRYSSTQTTSTSCSVLNCSTTLDRAPDVPFHWRTSWSVI